MKKYEVVFVFKPTSDEEALNATVAKFENIIKNTGGEVEKTDRWGKRRLAYEIKKFLDGMYVLISFSANPDTIAELDRVARITDEVLKHMIIKLED